jgi:hypothetical protein
MDRRRTAAVWALVSAWAGTAAADVAPRALARVARTAESRCASAMCQNVTDDAEPTVAQPSDADAPPPFSLGVGIGAAWLRTRVENVQVLTEELPGDALGGNGTDGGAEPPGSGQIRIDDEGTRLGPPPPDPTYRDAREAAYPTVSLTLDLQQPLASIGALNLRLAERFSLSAAPRVPGDDLSMFGGFADIVVGAQSAGFPVQAGVGPALGVLDVRAKQFGWNESVLVGVVGIVRVQLPGVPGTLDAVVHGTRLLAASPEAGSYRDAQLALTVPL